MLVESGLLILLHAIRSLARARWFTAGAVVTFALGIGTNIAVFALVDRLFFRPLPYLEAQSLFLIQEVDLDTGQRKSFLPKRYIDEARTRLAFLDARMAMIGGRYYGMDRDDRWERTKAWYDAMFLTLEKPFTAESKWGAQLTYTLGRAEEIGGDLFSLD